MNCINFGARLQVQEEQKALAMALQATPEGLERARDSHALFTQSLGQLLYALRIFSFS